MSIKANREYLDDIRMKMKRSLPRPSPSKLLFFVIFTRNMFLSKGCQIFKTFSEILLDLQARFGFLPLVFLQCAAVSNTWIGGCRCELWLTMFRDVHDDGGRPNHGCVRNEV